MTEQLVQSGRLQEKFCAQMPLIGDKAPAFEAETTKGMIRFPDDYAGKWVILFSHPADFTPVCTSELFTFAKMTEEFREMDAELVGFMDRNGLGTVATRANIIRTLLERKYIRYSGKYVIPTPKGLFFYETVRGMKIADASLTSGWEAELAQIERGERTPEEFLDGVLELVKGITGEIRRIQRPEE